MRIPAKRRPAPVRREDLTAYSRVVGVGGPLQGRARMAPGAIRHSHWSRLGVRQSAFRGAGRDVDMAAEVRSLHADQVRTGLPFAEASRLNDREITVIIIWSAKPGPLHEFGQMVNDAGGIGDALVVFVFIDKPVAELCRPLPASPGSKRSPASGVPQHCGCTRGICWALQCAIGRTVPRACAPESWRPKSSRLRSFRRSEIHAIGGGRTFRLGRPPEFPIQPNGRRFLQGFRAIGAGECLVHGDPKAATAPNRRPEGGRIEWAPLIGDDAAIRRQPGRNVAQNPGGLPAAAGQERRSAQIWLTSAGTFRPLDSSGRTADRSRQTVGGHRGHFTAGAALRAAGMEGAAPAAGTGSRRGATGWGQRQSGLDVHMVEAATETGVGTGATPWAKGAAAGAPITWRNSASTWATSARSTPRFAVKSRRHSCASCRHECSHPTANHACRLQRRLQGQMGRMCRQAEAPQAQYSVQNGDVRGRGRSGVGAAGGSQDGAATCNRGATVAG